MRLWTVFHFHGAIGISDYVAAMVELLLNDEFYGILKEGTVAPTSKD
jgi:hypothetical protein